MKNQTVVPESLLGCDQIGLVAFDPGRIMIIHIRYGRVCEVCFVDEEQLEMRLEGQCAVPLLLYPNTAHLAERLSAAGFSTFREAGSERAGLEG